MSKKDEALKQALEALDGMYIEGFTMSDSPINNAITAIREALAEQPAPPPPPECQTEAEKTAFAFGWFKALEMHKKPASKPWVGLEEQDMPDGENPMYDDPRFIAGMVWANNKLREKNNG